MEMEFEWDERKRRVNLDKHGIDFEDAIAVWEGDVIEAASPQFRHGEERFLAYGMLNGRIVCVVFTRRAGKIRIISARRARDHERKDYTKAIERETRG